MNKELAQRAWNAAVDHCENEPESFEDLPWKYGHLQAPSSAFDEWWEREVVNPPEGIESWGN